jgi:hypothetical protein
VFEVLLRRILLHLPDNRLLLLLLLLLACI